MNPFDVWTLICLYLFAGVGILFLIALASVKYEQWQDDRDTEEAARSRRGVLKDGENPNDQA